MGVDWRKSVEQACGRLVEFLGTCALDVQGVQSMQFALADFEAELSMALASGVGGETSTSKTEPLPRSLFDLVTHKNSCARTAGWRAITFVLRSKIPVDIFDLTPADAARYRGKEEVRVKGRRFVLHLVRALDGGGGSVQEQLEALQLLLSLCQEESRRNPVGGWRGEVRVWQLVLPSVVSACSVDDAEPNATTPVQPRVVLKALEVLRNIVANFPDQVLSLKHLKPLLSTLCTLSFLDAHNPQALKMEEAQREMIAMASQRALSSMLSHVTARKNLGWDTAALFGPILSPFTDVAIAEVPKDEEDILSWDQISTLRLLPSCMQGLFRMAQSWTGVFLLTTHTKSEKSVLEVLVQAFADTKVNIVRCVFVMLFSGLLGLPAERSAVKFWVEKTGINLDFEGVFFQPEGETWSSFGLPREPGASRQGPNFVELANRVHRGVLVNALYEAGLHFHLKSAMRMKYEPKKSIPRLLDVLLEMSHFCLTRENLILMQGCHDLKGGEERGQETCLAAQEELPDVSYLVSQSEMRDMGLRRLQSIVLGSNASTGTSDTATEERKTIMKTLRSSTAGAAVGAGVAVEDFNRGESEVGNLELDEKLMKLQDLMGDSGVLKYSSKYWKNWKWEYLVLILDLCKGIPEEGIKLCMRSKLLKRVFAFYAKRLPEVPIDNYKGRVSVQCGMELMKLLIETEEGRNFLSGKSSFMDQLPEVNVFETIVKGLEMETLSEETKKGRIFHPALVKHTHSFGLLRMALEIANTRRGIHMLYRFGITQALEHVILDGRNVELCRKILSQLNLCINDFPQKLVSGVVSSANSLLVESALLSLKQNLSSLPPPSQVHDESGRKTVTWFATFFVNALEKMGKEKQTYFAVLATKFCSLGYTKYLVNAGITKLGDKLLGFPNLLEHLLLDASGFKFLSESGWLENHIRHQLVETKTRAYMDNVQNLPSSHLRRWLRSALSDRGSRVEQAFSGEFQTLTVELSLENVFYCLGCTQNGLEWIVDHQILEMLVERIEDDDEPFVNRKAFLWYLALFASGSEGSGKKVVEVGGIDAIAFIAEVSSNFMLRGQAFVAMNVVCNNAEVARHLEEKHESWNAFSVDSRVNNGLTKVCLPRSLTSYLNLPRRKTMRHIQHWCASHRKKRAGGDLKCKIKEDDSVLSALGKLGNPIAEEEGKRDLAKLRKESPEKMTMSNSCLYWKLLLDLDIPRGGRKFLWAVLQ